MNKKDNHELKYELSVDGSTKIFCCIKHAEEYCENLNKNKNKKFSKSDM